MLWMKGQGTEGRLFIVYCRPCSFSKQFDFVAVTATALVTNMLHDVTIL